MKNTVKIIALILTVAIMLPLVSCTAWNEFWEEFTKETTTPTTKPGGTTIPPQDDMKFKKYAQPFWVGNTMYDESIMLVAKTDDIFFQYDFHYLSSFIISSNRLRMEAGRDDGLS